MAVSLECNFIKEFRKACIKTNFRFSSQFVNSIIPQEARSWEVSGVNKVYIRFGEDTNIGEYVSLDKKLVSIYPSTSRLAKREVDIVTRDFKKDSKGEYILKDVVKPLGSIAIISDTNLNLLYKKKPIDGFGYVDFIGGKNGKKKYIYIVPKKYLYPVTQVALVVSTKKMRNYRGMAYQTWRHGTIYLHLIPYKPNATYVGSKVLLTKCSMDFTREIKAIVDHWMCIGFIPDISLCNVTSGNLVTRNVEQAFDSYEKISRLSLTDKDVYSEVVV